jgi:cytochrome c553
LAEFHRESELPNSRGERQPEAMRRARALPSIQIFCSPAGGGLSGFFGRWCSGLAPLMKFPAPACLALFFASTVVNGPLGVSRADAADAAEPLWAYGFLTPPTPKEKASPPVPVAASAAVPSGEALAEQTRLHRVTGSTRTFSLMQIHDRLDVVDWFPDEHPPMPPIVQHGSPSLGEKAYGCALCHMPHGKGRPENASVSGLPPAYFIRQLQDFRNGLRSSSEPRKANARTMIALAQAMTDAEMKAAADYYATLSSTPWIRVVETGLVPKTEITASRMFRATSAECTEPIAGRIIEVPENFEQFELANPHVGFIAYVPIGSVKKGEALVTTGGATVVNGQTVPGKTVACATCHGPDLKGLAEVPRLAGRSPSYLARQIYDIQQGTRKAPLAQLMKPVVANLTNDDLVNIVAYLASLKVGPSP